MKTITVAAAALGLAGAIAYLTPHTSGEQTARISDRVPAEVVYHGNYERTTPQVTCYEGIPTRDTTVLGYPVKQGHWVMYCNDGWVTVQRHGSAFHVIRS